MNTEKRSVVSGSYVVSFHPKMSGKNITTIDGKCYIDGYELVEVNGKELFGRYGTEYFNEDDQIPVLFRVRVSDCAN
ncbi:hypothetical protein J2W97_001363 [Paenibacillus jamilae]|nr:hypothetical protein [Paenibacillus jamilae]